MPRGGGDGYSIGVLKEATDEFAEKEGRGREIAGGAGSGFRPRVGDVWKLDGGELGPRAAGKSVRTCGDTGLSEEGGGGGGPELPFEPGMNDLTLFSSCAISRAAAASNDSSVIGGVGVRGLTSSAAGGDGGCGCWNDCGGRGVLGSSSSSSSATGAGPLTKAESETELSFGSLDTIKWTHWAAA
jgi:hypothetical protein